MGQYGKAAGLMDSGYSSFRLRQPPQGGKVHRLLQKETSDMARLGGDLTAWNQQHAMHLRRDGGALVVICDSHGMKSRCRSGGGQRLQRGPTIQRGGGVDMEIGVVGVHPCFSFCNRER